jgi:hypothetical protein
VVVKTSSTGRPSVSRAVLVHGPLSAVGLGQQAEAVGRRRPSTVRGFLIFVFFYIFRNLYKLQKRIENTKKLRKI